MAHIFYSLSGEGRGHATRARAVIEELRTDQRVTVYTYGQAYNLLSPLYRKSNVEVRQIPGLRFRYTADNRLDYPRTLVGAMPYLWRLPQALDRLCEEIDKDTPDLVITDFEPLLPRAARRLGVPFISLDHQHFLLAYDLSTLPVRLRFYARLLSPWVRLWYSGQARTIVSSFYFPPLNQRYPGATRIGVLLGPEVMRARPTPGSYLVAYMRRRLPGSVLRALRDCGEEVRIYGLGRQPQQGNLRFHEVHLERFMEDLVDSRALVCTAGNQLVGEALYLGKPVLGIPEPGNFEQEINGHFLDHSGAGRMVDARHLTGGAIGAFVAQVDQLREQIDGPAVCGNAMALSIVRHHLGLGEVGARAHDIRALQRFGASAAKHVKGASALYAQHKPRL